jgi:diguanylate cyclase (GGDEF)-like protein/PAS domain S-box-containing protein
MINATPIRILHLEDSDADCELVSRQLREGGLDFTLKRVETEVDYVRELAEFEPELVLSDNTLPLFDSRSALSILRAHDLETPFILVSGTVGEERAVEMLKSGATDYVLKDRLSRLSSTVEHALMEAAERGARHRAEQAVHENAEQLRELADAMPQIVWAGGPDGAIDYFNKRWYDFIGVSDSQPGLGAWESILHSDDRDSAMNRYHTAIESGDAYEMECRLQDRKNGDCRWHLCRALPIRDSANRIVRWFGTATDIDDRKRAEQELLRNAYYDRLTLLPNRSLFEDRLAKAISASSRQTSPFIAVLFLDVDRFKLVNDSLGHSAGDKLLCAFARRLERLIRPCDTMARFGGDEFAVLLERLGTIEQARQVADRILIGLADPFHMEGYEISTTASIGISWSMSTSDTPESLLRDADSAMYKAKSLGPGRSEMFDVKMHATSLATLNLEHDMRRGLERSEFLVHYQPIFSLSTGRLTACEALVRWKHPARGLLMPDQFVALAEETGLIVGLGAWVLHTACAQMQVWLEAGIPPLDLAVNCSARQFTQNALSIEVGHALRASGFDARCLKLELTESVVMESSGQVLSTLAELKALGVQLSIDDFGTGYSSLAYLRRLPCTSLKIDRSFVKDVNRDEEDAAIASAIISMAHSLKLKVIAEGIETEAQRALLAARGCDEGQGYLFSRPVPAAEFGHLLRQNMA